MNAQPKPAHRDALLKRRGHALYTESKAKREVRELDKTCRFPLCGCHRRQSVLEVAHVEHKGMGSRLGRAHVNTTENMLLLCHHRHQGGAISMHHGTLRVIPLTQKGCRGPVAFQIDTTPLGYLFGGITVRVAEDEAVGSFVADVLERLARMDV